MQFNALTWAINSESSKNLAVVPKIKLHIWKHSWILFIYSPELPQIISRLGKNQGLSCLLTYLL